MCVCVCGSQATRVYTCMYENKQNTSIYCFHGSMDCLYIRSKKGFMKMVAKAISVYLKIIN